MPSIGLEIAWLQDLGLAIWIVGAVESDWWSTDVGCPKHHVVTSTNKMKPLAMRGFLDQSALHGLIGIAEHGGVVRETGEVEMIVQDFETARFQSKIAQLNVNLPIS